MLNVEQISSKISFIDQYLATKNAADGSKVDANANVTQANVATMEHELFKDYMIDVNRGMMHREIEKLFGRELADEYIRQLKSHEIYTHDETSLKPYCTSITMYPFLLDGLTKLGGESRAPEHLESFCGSFVNLIFAISSQFAGAVASVEFLMYFDHFAAKDFGDNYLETHAETIANHLQHVVYAINQPAASRGYQSVFWNISLYDKFYFESMFGNFVFPDFTSPNWERYAILQEYFMTWFNAERLKAVLTFPVVTAAMLTDGEQARDREFAMMCAKQLSEGNSFFIYQSPSADSLASCCRLRNEISDNSFSYSLGAGGVSTGSINVITVNMNRLIQDGRDLEQEIEKVQKYQVAYHSIIKRMYDAGKLPAYSAGFISLDKQFLTIGLNGLVEAAESIGIKADNNPEYKAFLQGILKVIFDKNKEAHKKYGFRFNTEFVPAENLGVKNSAWDKKDGYKASRDCYNSYFYPVEDEMISALDKMVLHGTEQLQYLDGGSALHLNLEEHLTTEAYLKLIDVAARIGCNYWCVNVKVTICNECGHMDKHTRHACAKCGSTNVDYATRIIGYLKRVSNFGAGRRIEHAKRAYTIC